jgi:subtilisin family serine protease
LNKIMMLSIFGNQMPRKTPFSDKERDHCVNKISIFLVACVFFLAFNPSVNGSGVGNDLILTTPYKDETFFTREILVKFKEGVPENIWARFHHESGLSLIRSFPALGVHHLRLPPSLRIEEALRLYRQNTDVEYAEPNYIIHACQIFPNDPPFDPGDPSYGVLWGLYNFGQNVGGRPGLPGADMNASDAWEISTGDVEVIIAITDSGVAYSHPELAPNMWTNPGEDPWLVPNDPTTGNGVDDDGNGKNDDWRGWDFVEGDNDPMDYHGHGTHVAGTIAAVGDNGEGITGVMWKAGIMSLRILDAHGIGTISKAIQAIEYAVQKGARVINASWGTPDFSESLFRSIQFCQMNGVLLVAAAGNSAHNTDESPFYPASYDLPNIISVAATDQRDNLASFSNWGPSTVDVAAPGVAIYSTWPSWYSIGESFPDDIESGPGGWTTGGTTQWAITDTEYNSPTHSWTDSPGGNYNNNADSWLLMPRVDLSRKWRCRLTYHLRMETEAYRDLLYVEASIDGITWTNIYGPGVGYTGSTGGTFVKVSDDISGYDGEPVVYIRFRLVTDSHNTFDGVHIDDVDITSISHVYQGDEFQFLQGTSMAAPHVSGLGGLLLSTYPNLSLDELRWRILNGVDELDGLAGKIAAGGRIDADNSLEIPGAPSDLSASKVSDEEVELIWADNSGDEQGFKIERRPEGETYVEIAQVGRDTTSYSDGDLKEETCYTYRVRAYNKHGNSAYSNEAATANPGGDNGLGGGSGGGCFIATAAYGCPTARSIDLLRAFRDQYLLAHPIGRKWVHLYYQYGPIMARFIGGRPGMRKAIRITLYPFVALSAGMMIQSTPDTTLMLITFLGCFSVMGALARRENSTHKLLAERSKGGFWNIWHKN